MADEQQETKAGKKPWPYRARKFGLQNTTSYKPPEVKEKVVADFEETKSIAKTAEMNNIHPRTVTNILSESDIIPAAQKARFKMASKLDKSAENICEQVERGDVELSMALLEKFGAFPKAEPSGAGGGNMTFNLLQVDPETAKRLLVAMDSNDSAKS